MAQTSGPTRERDAARRKVVVLNGKTVNSGNYMLLASSRLDSEEDDPIRVERIEDPDTKRRLEELAQFWVLWVEP